MREYTVGVQDAGQRLDRFLRKLLPAMPDSYIQKCLRTKKVRTNGKHLSGELRLSVGDKVCVYLSDEVFDSGCRKEQGLPEYGGQLEIVYEDRHILVLNKPQGLPVHDGGQRVEHTLIEYIQSYLVSRGEWNPENENTFAPALCHRLDRNTGGLIVAAKSAAALRGVCEAIRSRDVKKGYICAVHGRPSPPLGELRSYLWKDAVKARVYVYDTPRKGAKLAVTRYRTMRTGSDASLVECDLITGRTHQIRAQLAHIGCPIRGDGKYGRAAADEIQELYAHKLALGACPALPEPLRGLRFELPAERIARQWGF